MTTTAEQFAKHLRAARERSGLTLRECARRAHISAPWLSVLESGKATPPSEEVCVRLAQVLNESPLEMCRVAGRLPLQLQTQVLSDPGWFRVLMRARFKRLPVEEIVAFVESWVDPSRAKR